MFIVLFVGFAGIIVSVGLTIYVITGMIKDKDDTYPISFIIFISLFLLLANVISIGTGIYAYKSVIKYEVHKTICPGKDCTDDIHSRFKLDNEHDDDIILFMPMMSR